MANQVFVEELAITMQLKNNGIKLRVARDGLLRGYLQISKSSVKWFRGKGQKPCGEVTLEDFIKWAEKS
jgi:hypothetical protein